VTDGKQQQQQRAPHFWSFRAACVLCFFVVDDLRRRLALLLVLPAFTSIGLSGLGEVYDDSERLDEAADDDEDAEVDEADE